MNLHKYLKGQSSPTGVNFYDHIYKIKEKAKKWLKPLDKNGISHSKRIEEYLNKLIPDEFIKEKWLSPAEVFVLLYAVYLHDIGYIKDDGTIDAEDHPKRSGEKIRNNWTAYCFSSEFFPPYQNEHPRAAEAVAIVCESHAPEVVCKLNKIPQEFSDQALDSKPLNLKRLTALLRLADEADDPYIRGKASQSYRKNVVLVEIMSDIIVWHWDADKWNKGVNRQEIGAQLNDQIGEKEGLLESTNKYLHEFKLDKRLVLEPKLSLSPSEIQTRVKPPEIGIPTIQSVLRKGDTFEGDFFKKEPEWIDFEEGFVVARKEVDEIVKKLENENIQLVLGEPASGKSVILKNMGFRLANENKDVYIVELKKHSSAEVKRYFDDIPEIKDEKAVFIVDDAHLWLADCERLVRVFKNKKLKAKLIIGSRPTREIRGEQPKEASVFEYLSTTEIHAEDVTEEMIRRFLKRKYDFSDERIKTVSKNLEEYKKDLWYLSWALKAYDPKKDSVEKEEIYKKIRDSIRNVNAGKDKPGINAADVFLPLSVFYRFEIPIERNFLIKQLEIEDEKINALIELSEIIETEEEGRYRVLSLNHASIGGLYFGAYQRYPSLGERVKEKILNQKDADLEYCLFYKYIISTDPRNALDIVAIYANISAFFFFSSNYSRLVGNKKVKQTIQMGIEREEDIEKIGSCMYVIALAASSVMEFTIFNDSDIHNIFVASSEICNGINVDTLSSKIEKEEDIPKIGRCIWGIAHGDVEVAYEICNRINVDTLSSKIEKEEDILKIGECIWGIAHGNVEVAREICNRINVDTLSSKIEKEEDIVKIGSCLRAIAPSNVEVALKLVKCVSSKIEKEEDIEKIGSCARTIARPSGEIAFLSSRLEGSYETIARANEEVAQEIINRINVDALSSKIEKEEDILKVGRCVRNITEASGVVARKIVNRINVDTLSSKIEKEEDIVKVGSCVRDIAKASGVVAREIVNRLNPKLIEELRKEGWLK